MAAAQDSFQRWWTSLSTLAHVKCGKLRRTVRACEGVKMKGNKRVSAQWNCFFCDRRDLTAYAQRPRRMHSVGQGHEEEKRRYSTVPHVPWYVLAPSFPWTSASEVLHRFPKDFIGHCPVRLLPATPMGMDMSLRHHATWTRGRLSSDSQNSRCGKVSHPRARRVELAARGARLAA